MKSLYGELAIYNKFNHMFIIQTTTEQIHESRFIMDAEKFFLMVTK
jgi:hypothetical protein